MAVTKTDKCIFISLYLSRIIAAVLLLDSLQSVQEASSHKYEVRKAAFKRTALIRPLVLIPVVFAHPVYVVLRWFEETAAAGLSVRYICTAYMAHIGPITARKLHVAPYVTTESGIQQVVPRLSTGTSGMLSRTALTLKPLNV